MQHGAHADEARHRVHRVVVEEGGRVHGALGHDRHQLGDRQRLGLDQGLGRAQVRAELGGEGHGVDLGEQLGQRLGLGHLAEVEQQPRAHDGGGRGGQQEPGQEGVSMEPGPGA